MTSSGPSLVMGEQRNLLGKHYRVALAFAFKHEAA